MMSSLTGEPIWEGAEFSTAGEIFGERKKTQQMNNMPK